MSRAGPSNPVNWLEDLANAARLIQLLYDLLTADVPGETWQVTAPCNRDANGDPLVWSREFEAADYLPAITARVEALGDLIGETMAWKRRTCAALGGQPVNNVTITAYEVMEE